MRTPWHIGGVLRSSRAVHGDQDLVFSIAERCLRMALGAGGHWPNRGAVEKRRARGVRM